MALKDRLDARRRPQGDEGTLKAATLSVIDGAQPAAKVSPEERPADDAGQKSKRLPTTVSTAKAAIFALLVERHADEIDITDREGVRSRIASLAEEHVKEAGILLNRLDYGHLLEALLDEVLGLGPLQVLLDDPKTTEIMVNNPHQIYVERAGRVSLSPVVFESAAQMRQVIDRIVRSVGRRVDESSPMVDARLRDGSRVNVVLPPLAIDGPCLTIRKFSRDKLRPEDLLGIGSASPEMISFLSAAVRSKLSILVSGGTSSGKTTLLNILSGFIPGDERIVTIEDSAELRLRQVHVISLESKPANVEGHGQIAIRDLVRNSLRMRPDRIIVGEVRGGEALDMLQAMNTGHDGSMSTLHANNPRDAITRLETLVLLAGTELPSRAIRGQIASAINIVVQTERLRGGARKIVSVAEVLGMVDGEIALQELFSFRQVGVTPDGRAVGYHTATGTRSNFFAHFQTNGVEFPVSMFTSVNQPPMEQLY